MSIKTHICEAQTFAYCNLRSSLRFVPVYDLFKSTTSFTKRRPSHIATCEAVYDLFKSTTSFAKRRPSHTATCEAICDLFKSTTSFAKRRPSHTATCKAVCETNTIVNLRNKRHLTYLCDAIRIAKVSQTILCDSIETQLYSNLCKKKMEEREGTYKCCFEAGNATLP